MVADKEFGLTVHCCPFNHQDILDVSGEINPIECKVMTNLLTLPEISADLLTKKHDLAVEDISTGSDWRSGLSWMRLGTEELQLSQY